VADRRGQLEIIESGFDEIAGGRVPPLVWSYGIERVRSGFHPKDSRSVRVGVGRFLPTPRAQSATAQGRRNERIGRCATEDQVPATPPRGGSVSHEQFVKDGGHRDDGKSGIGLDLNFALDVVPRPPDVNERRTRVELDVRPSERTQLPSGGDPRRSRKPRTHGRSFGAPRRAGRPPPDLQRDLVARGLPAVRARRWGRSRSRHA